MKNQFLLEKRKRLLRRQRKTRLKLLGTATRPRLVVVKTLKHTSCQLIDDKANRVLLGMTDLKLREDSKSKTEKACLLGEKIGELLKRKKINRIVFDRHGYPFRGRVKALVDGLQKQGIKL